MNKKVLNLLIFCALALSANAQFLQGYGLMGGLTLGRQKWWTITPTDSKESQLTKRILRFNVELFAEFVNNPNFRWRTEFQYNQKGSTEKTSADKFKNKLDYICWNNFLIIRQEDFLGTPYILIGPRIEYKFKQANDSPILSSADFKPLHFTWSVGLGWEFVTYGVFKPLVEIHYNPAINHSYKSDLIDVKNRAWELRVGFKIILHQTKCPAVYK